MANEAHLQMIQDVVTRLASQSTTIKGWAVTVTGALLGYGVSQSQPVLAVIAGYAVVAFAVLDAYYLALERGYRELFTRAVAGAADDWALSITAPGPRRVLAAMASPAHLLLYGASLLIVPTIGIYVALTN